MIIKGYKAFYNDMTNQVGMHFEEGETYIASLPIKENYKGNGYHFAKNLEDTLCFVDDKDLEIKVAEVTGSGIICQYEYDYYGYYDLYCAEKIKIDKILTREEVLNTILDKFEFSAERFVKYYKLTVEEIGLFKKHYSYSVGVLDSIAYYQENDKSVYERKYMKKRY